MFDDILVNADLEVKNEEVGKDHIDDFDHYIHEKLIIFQNSIQTLKDMIQIQCSDGNWNYDSYMHGMANGMIFALSLFGKDQPEYLDAPDKWKKDDPEYIKLKIVSEGE